ncbi:sigma 54-interacting transcriptional regulator [Cedecea sp.]|jgi:transcriptional regulator with PAS, ATPase and Fis domain|uniref:sigma 54-interacting transcriptional regulator n=1 Tax=Cedecea sp. TaxID=1970739 RepID=UPI002F400EA4
MNKFFDYHMELEPQIKALAATDVDILIEGETGTGKDTIARKIFEYSSCKGEFVAVNCAAFPESLFESELFGVVSGAYTGASKSRAGYIEKANGGILFLDEIDSTSLNIQVKLLRFLETRIISRLGSTEHIPVNLRVLTASQTRLEDLICKEMFRRDLFFRISTFAIQIKPLRYQREYIMTLFRRFAAEFSDKYGIPMSEIDSNLIITLLHHPWPGNIRELKGAAQRFVLGVAPVSDHQKKMICTDSLDAWLRDAETLFIEECLSRTAYHVESCANRLGISKRALYYKLKRLSIELP